MSALTFDHDTVLRAIQEWPRAAQIELAQEILRVSSQRDRTPSTLSSEKEDSWARLIGLLVTDQPAPTDEEVERWRAERRLEKYGS